MDEPLKWDTRKREIMEQQNNETKELKIVDCTCAECSPRTLKPHSFTDFSLPLAVRTINFISVCLGEFTQRSYTPTNWYTKDRCDFKSPTDPMLFWAKDSSWQKFHVVRKDAADLSTAVYLGKW